MMLNELGSRDRDFVAGELGEIVGFHGRERKGCTGKAVPKFLFIDLDLEVILLCACGGFVGERHVSFSFLLHYFLFPFS